MVTLLELPRELRDEIIYWTVLLDAKVNESMSDVHELVEEICDSSKSWLSARIELDKWIKEDVKMRKTKCSTVLNLLLTSHQLSTETKETLLRHPELTTVELDIFLKLELASPNAILTWRPSLLFFTPVFQAIKIIFQIDSIIDDGKTFRGEWLVNQIGVGQRVEDFVEGLLDVIVSPTNSWKTHLEGLKTPKYVEFQISCPDHVILKGSRWNIIARQDLREEFRLALLDSFRDWISQSIVGSKHKGFLRNTEVWPKLVEVAANMPEELQRISVKVEGLDCDMWSREKGYQRLMELSEFPKLKVSSSKDLFESEVAGRSALRPRSSSMEVRRTRRRF